jgi:pimeloyl-ACP methyl ester carboxylesterase
VFEEVFGVSQGGMVAQYLAIDHPERVRKLVLGVTAARVNPVMEEAVGSWTAWAERGDYAAIIDDMMGERMYSAAYVKK